jgi:putative NADPH-quinone reductase
MSRILIVNGHPHDDLDHFVHALVRAYAAGAETAHEVRQISIARLDFPILRDPEDWLKGEVPAGLKRAQEDIAWAEHVVILYPLWLGDVPALLKAFLEQVSRPGFAIQPLEHGLFEKLLKGKSARIIVTMGMPAAAYRLWFRQHSVQSLKHNVLQLVGFSPVRVSLIGNVEGSDAHRRRWLEKVQKMGARGR